MKKIPKGPYHWVADKKVLVEVVEECQVWQTVLLKQRGVAYRDLRNGKLSVRLLEDFRESFVLVE